MPDLVVTPLDILAALLGVASVFLYNPDRRTHGDGLRYYLGLGCGVSAASWFALRLILSHY